MGQENPVGPAVSRRKYVSGDQSFNSVDYACSAEDFQNPKFSLEIVLVVILVLVLVLVLELELDFQRWNRRLRMAPRQQRFWGVFQLSGHAAHNPGWDRSQCERESFNL